MSVCIGMSYYQKWVLNSQLIRWYPSLCRNHPVLWHWARRWANRSVTSVTIHICAANGCIKVVVCLQGETLAGTHTVHLNLGSEPSGDTVPAHVGVVVGRWDTFNGPSAERLSLTADWALLCPLYGSSLHIRLLLYGNINRGCILLLLCGYLTSLPPLLSRLQTPHMETNLASQVQPLFWLLSKKAQVKHTVRISPWHFFPSTTPPSSIPVFFFHGNPTAIYGRPQ